MLIIMLGLVAGFVLIRLLLSKTFWSIVALIVFVAVFGTALVTAVNVALTVLWWLFVGAVVAGVVFGVMKLAERSRERNGTSPAPAQPVFSPNPPQMYPYEQTYSR